MTKKAKQEAEGLGSLETERLFLYAALTTSEGWALVPSLDANDFEELSYRQLFRIMREAKARLDFPGLMQAAVAQRVALGEELYKVTSEVQAALYPIKGQGYEPSLAQGMAGDWAQKLKDGANLRRMAEELKAGLGELERTGPSDPQGTLQRVRERTSKALDRAQAATSLLPEPLSLPDYLTRMKTRPEGLEGGYQALERNKIRFKPGTLSVIAARAGHGKTTFLLNLLVRMAQRYPEKAFYYFSYEENAEALLTKLIMILGGQDLASGAAEFNNYDMHEMKIRGKDVSTMPGIQKLAGLYNLHVIEAGGLDAGAFAAGIAQLERERTTKADLDGKVRPLGAVFLDYLQRVPAPAGPSTNRARAYELAEISNYILQAALSARIPVIAAAQVVRGVDKEGFIAMSDLADSSAIEKDAHTVLALWNERRGLQAQGKPLDPSSGRDTLYLDVLKNRTGGAGEREPLAFKPSLLTIEDY